MKNLLQVLDKRMKNHEAIIHVGESYDYREYSNSKKEEKPIARQS